MPSDIIFDKPHAVRFVQARQAMLRPVLHDLRIRLNAQSAADIGCGVGYFSVFLREFGFDVVGFDGRAENIQEAKRRHPALEFSVADVEDPALAQRSPYDLVLCVGLLYHLENPLRALRNLAAITGKALLIESYATPGPQTTFHFREEPLHDDQSLTYLALYPSETTLIKFCYRLQFPYVYRFAPLPDHEDFRDSVSRRKRRTMLLVSRSPLDLPYLILSPEPRDFSDPWETAAGKVIRLLTSPKQLIRGAARRLRRILVNDTHRGKRHIVPGYGASGTQDGLVSDLKSPGR